MLQEAREVFAKQLQAEGGERLVLDAHIPKDGTYRLIEMEGEHWRIRKTIEIRNDKKNNEIIGKTDSEYRFIQELDYYSKLLNMNKPMDVKKQIHGNNYLTLFVKKDAIVNNKLTNEIIDGYFDVCQNPMKKYEKKPKARKLYESVEEKIGPPDVKVLADIREYVKNNDLWSDVDMEKKDYMKIFFVWSDKEKTKEYYKRESERYLIPNIYNNNDFNEIEEGEIVGVPDNNMGLNQKKPFLDNKSRRVSVPYLLNQEEVLLQSKLFDYLMGEVSQRRYNIYINNDEEESNIYAYGDDETPDNLESGYYFRCQKGKNEVEIIQADSIVYYSNELLPNFYLKNYIGIPQERLEKSKTKYDVPITKLWGIKSLIDFTFFDGKLKYNFYTKPKDIMIHNGTQKRLLIESRNVLAAWFWRGSTNCLEQVIEKFTMELIKNSIANGNKHLAQWQLNLRWSLLNYLNADFKKGEIMREIETKLRENICSKEDWDFESDAEYAFAVGQVVSYFLSLSKSTSRMDAFVNPFLNAKSPDIIKDRIVQMYKKYNYRIKHIKDGGRFGSFATRILQYKPERIEQEYIMAGFTAKSLIYKTKDNESKEQQNKENMEG